MHDRMIGPKLGLSPFGARAFLATLDLPNSMGPKKFHRSRRGGRVVECSGLEKDRAPFLLSLSQSVLLSVSRLSNNTILPLSRGKSPFSGYDWPQKWPYRFHDVSRAAAGGLS